MQPEGIYDTLQERVSVEVRFTHDRSGIARLLIYWNDRWIEADQHFEHETERGDALQHHLHVTANGTYFELRFDTKRLQWWIERFHDPMG